MTQNITLQRSGQSAITIHTDRVEELFNKKLTVVTAPTSSANFSAGPKDPGIVDLLKVERRFRVVGHVDIGADHTELKAIFNAGGVVTMIYAGETLTVNFEKLQITEVGEDSNQTNTPRLDYPAEFTCITGVNIGGT